MTEVENLAYHDGASEEDFMEEAGSGVALIAHDYVERRQLDHMCTLLCGKGNNAGDAYVAGLHLLHLDYEVTAFQLAPQESCSRLCQENQRRFLQEGGKVREIDSIDDIQFPNRGIILDGIFGTGFRGNIEEPYSTAIQRANESRLPIIAIDIPSGLNGETGKVSEKAIVAVETAFLGLPKTGFFLEEGWNHVGKLRYVDFGLASTYSEELKADLVMSTSDLVQPFLPQIERSQHKYQRGYVIGLAGSPGMPGAAQLASLAALRGGAGIVRLLHPEGMQAELSSTSFEIIRVPYRPKEIENVLEQISKPSAVFIGPGMGRSEETASLLREILPRLQKPSVIDADALTLIGEEEIALPAHCLLTPHKGELLRLLKLPSSQPIDLPFLQLCQNYAEKERITLILKGGPTFIFHPHKPIHVNPVGDPGMATAGSGDILTGLLAALLAQGLSTHEAALLGVYIHGLAGEHAANELTSYCMAASDILYYFPEGFRLLEL